MAFASEGERADLQKGVEVVGGVRAVCQAAGAHDSEGQPRGFKQLFRLVLPVEHACRIEPSTFCCSPSNRQCMHTSYAYYHIAALQAAASSDGHAVAVCEQHRTVLVMNSDWLSQLPSDWA